LLLLLLAAGCGGAAPARAPASEPTTVAPSPAKPAPVDVRASDDAPPAPVRAEIDLPSYIGARVESLHEAVARSLGLPESASLTEHGLEVQSKGSLVITIFVHLMPESPGGPTYRGPLFRGIRREMTRAQIEKLLGAPSETGATSSILDSQPRTWIKYLAKEAQIHFQFRADGALEMITLMEPDWRPGK
jgi:hypothetical protein